MVSVKAMRNRLNPQQMHMFLLECQSDAISSEFSNGVCSRPQASTKSNGTIVGKWIEILSRTLCYMDIDRLERIYKFYIVFFVKHNDT